MAFPMETITLIDDEENKTYKITLPLEDVQRVQNNCYSTILKDKNTNSTPTTSAVSASNEDKDKEQHHWSREQTLLLIDIYKTKEEDFHNGKSTVKCCWENVSKEMKKRGYNINGAKCAIKFQAMKRTYKSIKDHNRCSGNDTRKWEYFDVIDKLFNKKPWIKPPAVAGTSVETNNKENSESSDTSSIEGSQNKLVRRKRKFNMELYMEKSLQEKILKRESADRRHLEKMEQLKKIEEILHNAFQK